MPGNVQSISGGLDVYPISRFRQLAVSHIRETAVTNYADGSFQSKALASAMKKQWQVSHVLTSAEATTLRTFWKNHVVQPFSFTDVTNGLTYKATFTGPWNEERTIGDRYQITLTMIEAL